MADTLLAALTETSAPDFSDYTLWEDNTGPTSGKISVGRLIGLLYRPVMMGRLTLETGVPVSTTDQLAKSTLYWTPQDAGYISLFDGTRWVGFKQAELSLALSGLTSGKNYDAFLSYNAGTPALVLGPAWTNDTTRATGLTTQDGILVLSGTTTSRYVGTIRAVSATTTADSGGITGTTQVGAARFVWNYYNRVRRPLMVQDASATWSYTTNTWRVADGATGPLNCVEWVSGHVSVFVQAVLNWQANQLTNSARGATSGLGLDSTTAAPVGKQGQVFNPSGSQFAIASISSYEGYPGLGYHYLSWMEKGGDNSCLFYGNSATDQMGIYAWIEG